MPFSLLHVGHSLSHGLQHLGLHYQNLLKCWGWRRIVGSIVVLIFGTVAGVSHLMTGKRFEIEIDKEKIEVRIPNYMHQGIMMIKIFLDNYGEAIDKAHKQPTTHTEQAQTSIIKH
jgi:hypothetical protein